MASPRIVAIRRQNAEVRLWRLVTAASAAHGLSHRKLTAHPNVDRELRAVEMLEAGGDVLEQLIGKLTAADPDPQRPGAPPQQQQRRRTA